MLPKLKKRKLIFCGPSGFFLFDFIIKYKLFLPWCPQGNYLKGLYEKGFLPQRLL
jgi:hypothetical protein